MWIALVKPSNAHWTSCDNADVVAFVVGVGVVVGVVGMCTAEACVCGTPGGGTLCWVAMVGCFQGN